MCSELETDQGKKRHMSKYGLCKKVHLHFLIYNMRVVLNDLAGSFSFKLYESATKLVLTAIIKHSIHTVKD